MLLGLRAIHAVAARLPVHRIGRDGDPYLDRFYLGEVAGYTFYLHRFLRKDYPSEGVHNHPWTWGRSLVLCGSYIQECCSIVPINAETIATARQFLRGPTYVEHIQYYNYLSNDTFHRVASVFGTEVWTLFWHPLWSRHWGFMKETGFELGSGRAVDREWWHDAPKGRTVL